MTLRSFQLRLTRVSGETEDLEFTAPDLDRAAQAVADRAIRAGSPIKTIVSADGRVFEITNEGVPHGTVDPQGN